MAGIPRQKRVSRRKRGGSQASCRADQGARGRLGGESTIIGGERRELDTHENSDRKQLVWRLSTLSIFHIGEGGPTQIKRGQPRASLAGA